MNRTSRTVVVLAIAVALAGVASFGVYRVVSRRSATPEVTTINAVVAAQPLKLGDRITADHVRLVAWPATNPVGGSFTKIEEVLNRGVITSVSENEPLTETKLAPIEAGAGLPPSIPDGMRAISVKVNEVIGVAGFVVPGTRVDVMVTLSNRGSVETMTRVVLSNVQVLTAGTRYDQEKAKEGVPMPSSVVTLLVTPEDGERIALAATEGNIMLSLRNPLDTKPTTTAGIRIGSLMGQQPVVPQPAVAKAASSPRRAVAVAAVAPPPPPAPKGYTVEAIRGAKRTEEVVR